MKKRKIKNKKIVVAMSGGVDSSVAAALLKQQGYDLIGVFMKFWLARNAFDIADAGVSVRQSSDKSEAGYNQCCSPEAETRARKVAKILDIPFYVFNFEKEFKKRVVDYFLKEYKAGRTPNPCVVCNKEIKFGLLIEKALKLSVDYVATGHYTRKLSPCESEASRRERSSLRALKRGVKNYKLFKGKDEIKDQSYFLWKLNQKQLKHILFPVGEYTKVQVRKLAKKFNLPVLDVPESQEICFIQTTLNDFLIRYIQQKPGKIIDVKGKKIGQHQGLSFYTIGQRKGIELSGGPFYVVSKDLKKNNLIVAQSFNNKALYSKSLIAKNINWVSGREPKFPLKIKVQIRYRHKAVTAVINKKLRSKRIELIFIKSQRAITPGQSVVFYSGQEVLGGGIIG